MKNMKDLIGFAFCLSLMANINIFATDPTVLWDFDGDGKTDVAVYDALPYNSQTPIVSNHYRYISSISGNTVSTVYGFTYDEAAPADYDGDGKTDLAIYRWLYPQTNDVTDEWWIQGSKDGQVSILFFGPPIYGLVKLPRDYDGDGKAEPSFFNLSCDYGDPKTNEDDFCSTYYSYLLDNGESFVSQLIKTQSYSQTLGGGDPAPGDYNGDGVSEIAVYDKAVQKFKVFLYPYSSIDLENIAREKTMDIDFAAPGDYNGDGRTDFAGVTNFQTPTVVPMIWKVQYNKRAPNGPTGFEVEWGMSNEYPVPGDYDGDGKTDLAVYNKQTGTWKIRQSSDLSTVIKQLGDAGDFPVPFPMATNYYFNYYGS